MINLQRARELLKLAVETQGRDFVYSPNGLSGCYYAQVKEIKTLRGGTVKLSDDDPRTKTGCLVGTALDLAGETRHHGYPSRVYLLAIEYSDMMDDASVQYFRVAQDAQDNGSTWGQAYDKAEDFAKKDYLMVAP